MIERLQRHVRQFREHHNREQKGIVIGLGLSLAIQMNIHDDRDIHDSSVNITTTIVIGRGPLPPDDYDTNDLPCDVQFELRARRSMNEGLNDFWRLPHYIKNHLFVFLHAFFHRI